MRWTIVDQYQLIRFIHSNYSCHSLNFIVQLVEYLKLHPQFQAIILSPGVVLGGAVCYYGTQLVATCRQLTFDSDTVFQFSILYMIVDSLLDQPNSGQFKSELKGILSGKVPDNPDPIINQIVIETAQLFQSVSPEAQCLLREAFNSEMATADLQSGPNQSRETYWNMASSKGGTTVRALYALIGGIPGDDENRIGTIIQLIDDCYDVQEDLDSGILTVATHDFVLDGHLDRLLDQIEEEIGQLPTEYQPLIHIFHLGLLYFEMNKSDRLSLERRLIVDEEVLPLPVKLTETVGNNLMKTLIELLGNGV